MSIQIAELEQEINTRAANYGLNEISALLSNLENVLKVVAINKSQLNYQFNQCYLSLLDRIFGEDTTVGVGA